MLRTASLVILALLAASPASSALAGLPGSIAVGPDGIVDPAKEPYFVWISRGTPEIHSPGGPEDDCGQGNGRQDPRGTLEGIVAPIPTWDPTEYLSLNKITPQCVATQIRVPCAVPTCPPPLPARAYAAYDVGTGRFYVEAATDPRGLANPLGLTLLPATQNAEQGFSIGGNSGMRVLTDCEACPTPP